MKRNRGILAACLAGCLACGDADSGPDTPAAPDDPSSAPDDPEEPVDAGDTLPDAGDTTPDASDATPEVCDVPSEPAALIAYLRRGDYKQFERESAVHASTGPHGGRVLTYVNEVLGDSLRRGNAEHPRCAASIKELFLGKDEVSGWAVFVKTEQASAKGKGYYWLETTSTRPNRSADYEGQGIGVCVGCHSTGRDYFRAPWPLQ